MRSPSPVAAAAVEDEFYVSEFSDLILDRLERKRLLEELERVSIPWPLYTSLLKYRNSITENDKIQNQVCRMSKPGISATNVSKNFI